MGLNSKNPYKGKIQALEAKLGLFGTIFGPFWDFVVIFTKMKEKTCKKSQKRSHDISHVKKYIQRSVNMIGLESIKDMHMIHCVCPNGAKQ